MFTRLIGFFITLAATLLGVSAIAQPFTGNAPESNVQARLVLERTIVRPGDTFHIALEQKIARGWHTYWRNPGDSGEPTNINWSLPEGVSAGAIKWPAPDAIPFGPLVNYGFSDQVVLHVEIKVPANAAVGAKLDLIADVTWLECADICIPGGIKLSAQVEVGATSVDGPDKQIVTRALDALPRPFTGTTQLTATGSGGLKLAITGMNAPREAYFFPYEVKNGALIDFAQPQKLTRLDSGFALDLVRSPSFPQDLMGPIGGVLVLGKGASARAFEISSPFDAAQGAQATPNETTKTAALPQTANIGVFAALGLAFLGGLILNLMPCVFPILSMKVLGLVAASQSEARAARAHGLWYGAGVIVSFLALAGILIALQSAGQAAGWGFQLQNPAIVIVLAVIMTLVGFNLLGFFELEYSLQNVGAGAVKAGSARGSALTGVLAVVVAAPCTAPFMGAALGFAATQPAGVALLVFAALGLGFALPFVALTFAPALLSRLPKPGPWMVRLREALAFPMFATAIWLIWVATAQSGQAGVLAGLIGVFGAALGVWIARTWSGPIAKAVALAIVATCLTWATLHVTRQQSQQISATREPAFGEAWSPQRVAELQSEGKTVFVNFTADWCVTCKVNEASVFTNSDVRAALTSDKAAYLVADWTRKDGDIAEALSAYGRVGVPLYLVYKPDQKTAEILPQILTRGIILDALD